MKWALIIVGILAGMVAAMWAVGALLPLEHEASRAARYAQPPEKIWEAITNIEAMPQWRSGLHSVHRLPDRDGKPTWIENSRHGEMPLEVVEWEPLRKLVGRIADDSLPFGGTWTYEITPADGGAVLRITERGHVKPALFRFMARFIFGYSSTLETYLRDLGRKFGEEVTPEQ
jgi:uncharacterized protein YndB with AHSA1/START domain